MPCYKLGIRLADPSIVRRFYKSGKWGFYLAVLQEGEIQTGDEIIRAGGDGGAVTLADVARSLIDPNADPSLIARVLNSNLAEQMKGQLLYQASKRSL